MKKIGFILLFALFMTGCASSNVSRTAASDGDVIKQKTQGLFAGAGNTNIADSYQNTNQMTKGALLGGAIGGGVGGLAPRLGFFPGLLAGAIVGAGYGAYIDAHATIQDQLENRGANVIVLGDQVKVIFPSANLFEPGTANVKPQAYSTINLLARYINSHDKMLVKIAAYTNPLGPSDINLALSRDQARQIERYLVADGVNARVLYADGYGDTDPVERISKEWDGSQNYRIEIALEKLPPV